MKEDLLKIINHYGLMKQLKYIHSEYFELDEAIIKYYDPEELKFDKEHIVEEIADITVMLKQIQYYFELTDEQIDEIMKEKIERQLERIKNE